MRRRAPDAVNSGVSGAWLLLVAVAMPVPPAVCQEPPAPARPFSLEERGDIFMARKEYEDALDYYSRALKQQGSSEPLLWNKIGIAFEQQSKLRQAEKAFQKATRLNHDYPEAWNNLGTVYYQENKYGKSVRFYRRAIELRQDSASFHLNLGSSYYHMKKIPEALEEYRAALRLDPTCLTAHSSTGTVVQARGADAEFFFYLAKVFASMGRAEDAVRYLRRALEDGLKDHQRLEDDLDFQKISKDPAYVQLINNPPVAIKD